MAGSSLIGGPGEGRSPIDTGPNTVDFPVSGQPAVGGTPLNVTLPGAQEPATPVGPPAPATEQTFQVTVQGQPVTVTLDELRQGYSRHEDYTRKTQELAQQRESLQPYQELYDYLKENPAAAQTIADTLSNYGQAGGAQPGQPYADPAVKEQIGTLEKRLEMMEVNEEVARFRNTHPESNVDEVMKHALQRNIPNLEDAFKAMMYDRVVAQGPTAFADAANIKAQANVETRGAGQPPPSQTIDVRGKTSQELWKIGSQAYGPLWNDG